MRRAWWLAAIITPFVAGLAIFTVVTADPAQVSAATWTVTNCNDSGAGSLRQAVLDASSGDTIGFATSRVCSLITLASDIVISKNLTVVRTPELPS